MRKPQDPTLEVVEDLIFENILGLIFEVHRQGKLSASVCHTCHTRCRQLSVIPPKDMKYPCPCCSQPLQASRFAPHLEKCFGMGRRRKPIQEDWFGDSDDEKRRKV